MRQESKIFLATLSLAMFCIIAVSLNSSFAKNDKNKKIKSIKEEKVEEVEEYGVLRNRNDLR
jgi:hypothetical protein